MSQATSSASPAENTLKDVFTRMGAVKSFRASVYKTLRRTTDGVFMPQGAMEVMYRSKNQYRIYRVDPMDGMDLMISDGKTLRSDPLSDEDRPTLYAVKPDFLTTSRNLSNEGGSLFTVLLLLTQGDAGYTAVAPTAVQSNGDWVSFESKKLGKVALRLTKDSKPLVIEATYDNAPYWESRRKTGTFRIPADPMYREEISYVSIDKPLDDKWFLAEPVKGEKVNDQRKIGG